MSLSTLAGRFELQRLAGRGGMGEVWQALDTARAESVAIKFLHGRTPSDLTRFEREIRILRSLEDPRIVRCLDHGLDSERGAYLVMEWLAGEDLATRIARGPLAANAAVSIVSEVALALGSLHALGIVHRDLKPSNVFLSGSDGQPDVKLLDFGVAWNADSARMTATGALIGTAGYMAPEQARAQTAVGPRSDVFALGCLLFEALTGEAAFRGDQWLAILTRILFDKAPRLDERCPAAPAALVELLARMLAKEPSERPADGLAVAAELRALPMLPETPLPLVAPPSAAPSLTDHEQRALAIILVGPSAAAAKDDDTFIAREVSAHGAMHERLLDGSDAIFFWSARVPTDLAVQAASCALALSRRASSRRIALAMGTSDVLERLSTGQAIDRAALLIAATGGNTLARPNIALDEVTAALLEARFEVRRDGPVFRLVAERDLSDARPVLGRVTPCVGRDRELRALRGLFEDCCSDVGGAQVALVTGAPGLGKSRVARELLRGLETPRLRVWAARGDPVRAGSAFSLLSDLVQSALNLADAIGHEPRLTALHQGVAALDIAPNEEVAEFLGELIGLPSSAAASVQLRAARRDPQLMSERIRESFSRFLAASLAGGPVILLLEDMHWGDLATVQVLDRALGELEDLPLFVLALGRPEVHEVFPGLWSSRLVQEFRLRELPRRAAAELVRSVLGNDADAALVDRLVGLSDGNAFYLEELIRAAATDARGDLPATVVAMVQSRLNRLTDEERRTLRAASIFGETFWGGGVASLVGWGTQERLQALVEQELVLRRATSRLPGEVEYAFRHALLREGAYALLTDADRTLGHRLAGEWLERHGEDDALVLAEHFERGGAPETAAALYLKAAERAGLAGDAGSAIAFSRRGLACDAATATVASHVRTRLLGVSCQFHYHRIEVLDEAFPDAETLLQLAPRGSAAWAQAMLVRTTVFVKSGRMPEFGAAMQEVLATDFDRGAGDPASLTLATICFILDLGGQRAGAAAAFSRLTEVARRSSDETPSVGALHSLFHALRAPYVDEDPWLGRELAAVALATARRIGHRKYAAMAELFAAATDWFLGDGEGARKAAKSLDSWVDESGFASATRPFMMAWSLAEAGAFGEAKQWAERLVASGAAHGLVLDEARGHWALGEVARREGDLATAGRELERAVALLRQVCPLDLPGALASLAALKLVRGEAADAAALADEAMSLYAGADGTSGMQMCSQFFRGGFLRATHLDALAAAGRDRDADRARRAARSWVEAIAGRIPDDAVRSRFLSSEDHRRLRG